MTKRFHLFPYRTQKLSSSVPMVLDWQRSGRVGRRRIPINSVVKTTEFFLCQFNGIRRVYSVYCLMNNARFGKDICRFLPCINAESNGICPCFVQLFEFHSTDPLQGSKRADGCRWSRGTGGRGRDEEVPPQPQSSHCSLGAVALLVSVDSFGSLPLSADSPLG